MSVRVCNNRSPSPLGIFGRGNDRCRIIAQGSECDINGWNSKADASAKCGRPVGRKRIKLEHAARKLCGVMLWPATVPML